MRRKKILLQWIGHSDLRALAANSSPSRCEKLMSTLGGKLPEKSDFGPTRTPGNSALAAHKNIRSDARTLQSREGHFPCAVAVLRSLHHESTSAFTSPFVRNAEI
jgi:hypothetical protein